MAHRFRLRRCPVFLLLAVACLLPRVTWSDEQTAAELKPAQFALDLILKVEAPRQRQTFLYELATGLLVSGDRDMVRQVAQHVTDSARRDNLLVQAGFADEVKSIPETDDQKVSRAEALAESGRMDEAYELLMGLDDYERNSATGDIAVIAAKTGKLKEALAAVGQIEKGFHRGYALQRVAEELVRRGDVDGVTRLAEQAGDSFFQMTILTVTVEALLKADEFNAAVQFAESITKTFERDLIQMDIVSFLVEHGKAEDAKLLAGQIQSTSIQAVAMSLTGQHEKAHQLARTVENDLDRAVTLARVGLPEEALKVGATLENQRQLPRVQNEVTRQFIAQGEFEKAVQTADKLKKRNQEVWKQKIAESLAAAGEFDRAIQLAEELPTGFVGTQMDALQAICSELAKAGMIDRALAIARKFDDEFFKEFGTKSGTKFGPDGERTVHRLIREQAQQGNADRAMKLVNAFPSDLDRDRALSSLPGVLSRAGRFKDALQIVEGMSEFNDRDIAYRTIAVTMASTTGTVPSLEIVAKIRSLRIRNEAIAQIALSLASEPRPNAYRHSNFDTKLQLKKQFSPVDQEAVQRVLALSQSAREPLPIDENLSPADLLVNLVRSANERGALSPQTLNQALLILQSSGHEDEAEGIAAFVRDPMSRAVFDAATGALEPALQQIKKLEKPEMSDRAINGVAMVLSLTGQADKSIDVLNLIQSSRGKARTASQVASILAASGNEQMALDLARSIKDSSAKVRALAWAGATMEALRVARAIKSEESRKAALEGVASILAEVGKAMQALKLIQEHSLDGESDPTLLDSVCEGLVRDGHHEAAIDFINQFPDPFEKEPLIRKAAPVLAAEGHATAALKLAESLEMSEPVVAHILLLDGKTEEAVKQIQSMKESSETTFDVSSIFTDLCRAGHIRLALEFASRLEMNNVVEFYWALEAANDVKQIELIVDRVEKLDSTQAIAVDLTKAGLRLATLPPENPPQGVFALRRLRKTFSEAERRQAVRILSILQKL